MKKILGAAALIFSAAVLAQQTLEKITEVSVVQSFPYQNFYICFNFSDDIPYSIDIRRNYLTESTVGDIEKYLVENMEYIDDVTRCIPNEYLEEEGYWSYSFRTCNTLDECNQWHPSLDPNFATVNKNKEGWIRHLYLNLLFISRRLYYSVRSKRILW